MNNLFKNRKINRALKLNSDSFLGIYSFLLDKDLKDFYEEIKRK
jgi:hypothetical protein